jgi:CubicO group peptidase (beta-lactamase class C family)
MPRMSGFICKLTVAVLLLVSVSRESQSQQKQPARSPDQAGQEQARIDRFEKELEQLRLLLKIPGMSAAILKDRQVVWAKGFGYSDYEGRVAATPETPYEIASLTKTMAATLLMQLVEQGKVSLDDPMSKYSAAYKDDAIKVRHVLTMTSEGSAPGDAYEYNGNLFANLFDVIVKASGERFRKLLVKNILEKTGMNATVPGNDVGENPAEIAQLLGADNEKNYVSVLKRLANSYRLYGADEIIRTFNPRRGLSTANGIISTVNDLAKYDAAIDRQLFMKKETQEEMWTAARSNKGETLPYGLGWFVQQHHGLKLIWHNGNMPDFYSALILKVPEKRITFILLANSDALSAPFRLARGNVMNSAFAGSFLRTFVFEDIHQVKLTEPDWTLSNKDFKNRLARLEKRSKGYRYEYEADAGEAIGNWLDTRRAEAHREIKLDRKIYAAYAGEYRIGANPAFTILDEGGRLMRQGRTKIELFPESETQFFAKAVDALFIFIKDEKGKITQLKIRQGENELVANRVK